jgi:hypothetical protein
MKMKRHESKFEDNEIFLNNVECEDEVMEKTHEEPSLQMKESEVLENNEEKLNFFLELLHSQRKTWRPHNKNVVCWSFLCVNDNLKNDI